MTEPENFEEDLFADLYDDNEASSAPAPVQKESVPEPPPAPVERDYHPDEQVAPATDENGYGGDYHENEEAYDDDDDDVDFNLGNGSSYAAAPKQEEDSTPAYQQFSKGTSTKGEDGKMFIGGLNWETTDQSLRDYFTQFGEVTECTVMRDGATGRSRGFGFLTFKDPKTVNIVMVKEHFLDGKIIDPKRAIPRDEQEKTSKIFVGGVSQETTESEFKDFFSQFGRVVDATLMMDKDTGRPRGFGFVTFESEAGVDACTSGPLEIHGKPIEVKKAQPRGNMREEEDNSRRTKFRKGGVEDQGQTQNQMPNQMAAQGGMTPQVMAQYMQRMQQYMAVVQQQMAMNRGMGMGMMGNMNPAMMQMMQMQMAQQMAQGGAQNGQNPMAGMNPAMMQQMQNQMQNQMNQMNQGGGQGNDQQQGFGNQYGGRGGGRRGGRGGYGQGGYGMGGGGGGGGGTGSNGGGSVGGDATSWEGMYDDVPQPNANRGGFNRNRGGGGHHQQSQSPTPSDPTSAPPANAPTGPKNAGRPGANYRGGGRGGNRGFHPYQR